MRPRTRAVQVRNMGSEKQELKRKKAFRNRSIRWPMLAFAAILVLLVAFAAVWQKSREPKRRTQAETNQLLNQTVEEEIAQAKTAEELQEISRRLEKTFRDSTEPGQMEVLRRLIAISDRTAELTPDPEQVLAAKAKALESLNLLFAIEHASGMKSELTRRRIAALSSELHESSSPAARLNADLGKIAVSGLDLIADIQSEQKFEAFRQAITTAIARNPDQFRICDIVEVFLDGFNKSDALDRDKLIGLIDEVSAGFAQAKNETIQEWVRTLKDNRLFAEHRYKQLLYACEINSPGAVEETMAAIKKILTAGVSPRSLARLLAAANVFEKRQEIAAARELYGLIRDQVSVPASGELSEIAQASSNGLTRLDFISRNFLYSGTDVLGNPLQPEDFLGQPALVVYLTSLEEMDFLRRLLRDVRGPARRGMGLIVVFQGEQEEDVRGHLQPADHRLMKVLVEPNQQGPLSQQCPVEMTPYLLLIDRQGIVNKVAVDPVHVYSLVEEMMGR